MAGRQRFAFGRKRRNDIWTHFRYIDVQQKTECVVKTDGEKCGHKIAGKNTTNLKRHLKAFHDLEYPDRASVYKVRPKRIMDKPTTTTGAQDLFATSRNNDNSSPQQVIVGRHFGSLEEGECEVKMEDTEASTDEFEFGSSGFPQRDRQGAYVGPTINQEITGAPVENGLSSPPQHIVSPPQAPPLSLPLIQSAASPRPHTQPHTHPHPHKNPHTHHNTLPGQPTCLEPVLRHLSECFKSLVSESRALLVELETQRRDQARCHQDILSLWLQKDERREREREEREERRDRERMEHEIRVLQILTGLGRDNNGCKCGGSNTGEGPAMGPNHGP